MHVYNIADGKAGGGGRMRESSFACVSRAERRKNISFHFPFILICVLGKHVIFLPESYVPELQPTMKTHYLIHLCVTFKYDV